MELVQPRVRVFIRPEIDWNELHADLLEIGAQDWGNRAALDAEASDAELLVEIAGRICYRSWEPGLNPNVTKVRTDRGEYLKNILVSKHGSVLEHAQFTFMIRDVSRVLTHELARHRAGTATSQESGRYIRLSEIEFWFPDWALEDETLMNYARSELGRLEAFQRWMGMHFRLDDEGVPFHEKKEKTSFMRRFAPEGRANSLVWSANIRALRHIIEVRTAEGAEEEIRIVFGMIAERMIKECPMLFGDFQRGPQGAYIPEWRKV